MDEQTLDRLLELRLEIAALSLENSAFAERECATAAEKHTQELRRERLETIKEELLRLRPARTS
jgi:hypothetical protein